MVFEMDNLKIAKTLLHGTLFLSTRRIIRFRSTGRFTDLRLILPSTLPGIVLSSGFAEVRPRLQWRVRDGFTPSSLWNIAEQPIKRLEYGVLNE